MKMADRPTRAISAIFFVVADLQLYAFQDFHLWHAFIELAATAFFTSVQKDASFSSAFLLRAFFMRFTPFRRIAL
jgi:hypothetical protein